VTLTDTPRAAGRSASAAAPGSDTERGDRRAPARDAWADRLSGHLVGQVALVTGGGSGLGRATCDVLAAAGMRVLVADISPAGREETAASIRSDGGTAEPIALDVSDPASAADGVATALDRWGRLDVLVNNAGVDRTAPFDELEIEDWDRILAVNLRGPVVMTKAALPAMRQAGRGHIVNITSTAAKRAWENASAYHATKWGLLGLSHALHTEARREGIKVTAVVCGGMRTPFLLDRFPDLDPGLLQDPRTVAETIRFALSLPDESVIPEITVLPMRETSWP
jgi:NAD(P)-dependent dehydrogenase (short-subunit alcohol dehydrogenase family)